MSQVVQVSGPRRTRGPRGQTAQLRGIVQGAAGTAPVAFGATAPRRQRQQPKKKKRNGGGKGNGAMNGCWNAFDPQHLALPRAVGEYTVTRGTKALTTNAKLIIVGAFQYNGDTVSTSPGYGRNWSDVVALQCEDLSKKPSEVAWTPAKMPLLASGMGEHSQILPSAVSVQVMNPNALQTTSGITYIGKLKVQPAYAGDDVDTAGTIANNFVSYMAPRLCSAGKLALRGVHVDAHPLNMNRLADFTQIYRGFSETTSDWPDYLTPVGFTPIMIYNPNGVELELLIGMEFRTRFELFNPACSSHKFHAPSTDATWAGAIKKACDMGSGAMDIADVVAKSGLLQRIGKLV